MVAPCHTVLEAEPTAGIFTNTELRALAGVDDSDTAFDVELGDAEGAALSIVGGILAITCADATVTDYYDRWDARLELSRAYTGTVTVTYRDDADAEQTIADTEYVVDDSAQPSAVAFDERPDHELSTQRANPISVAYDTGVPDRGESAVQEAVKVAFKAVWGRAPDSLPLDMARQRIEELALRFGAQDALTV